jgi:prophage regulatory protein
MSQEKLVAVSRRDTAKKLLCTPVELSRKVARGEFPRPVKLGKRRIAWFESDIEKYLAARAAEREATEPVVA